MISPSHPTDITSPHFMANPFPYYAQLRAEQPICHTRLPDKTPIWLVTRHADVDLFLKDNRFAKNRREVLAPEQLRKEPWVPAMFKPLERNMLDTDPPDHTRLRALVHKAFTPRLIEQMRARIQTLADELLASVAPKGEMDLLQDYALPLPMTIITEILGVPPRDRNKFHSWSKAIVSVNSFRAPWLVIPSIFMFYRYLRGFFKFKRAQPGDDLTSALIQVEEGGDKLGEDELMAMIFLLLIAGHETTVNLIGSGTLALLQYPDQMDKLRRDPALIKTAVEELLRYTTPVVMSTERYAREAITLHDVTIPRGELVFGVIGSANRDETVFEKPETLDLAREPNKHLAFGQGVHYCLGAPLARLEAQIAINTLLRHMPHLRLKVSPESLRWRRSLVLRGLEALPVKF